MRRIKRALDAVKYNGCILYSMPYKPVYARNQKLRNAVLKYHEGGLTAPERRRTGRTRCLCRLLVEHKNDLKKDPERLTTSFMLELIKKS